MQIFNQKYFQLAQNICFITPKNLNTTASAFNFGKSSKKVKKQSNSSQPLYNIYQALTLARCHSIAAFEETIDVCVNLNVNPKHGNQIVRGVAAMPGGVVKQTKICVFANGSLAEEAKQHGADVIGNEKLIEEIKKGNFDFDKIIATSDQMPILKPHARQLGPKGLMPNAKTGTLVQPENLIQAIKNFKQGQVTYRVDLGSNIHAPLGKLGFADENILQNLNSLLQSLLEKKPTMIKGTYFRDCYLKSTMGPSWKIDIDQIDPRSKNYILKEYQPEN